MRNLVSGIFLTGLLIGCGGSTPKQVEPTVTPTGQDQDASSQTVPAETAEEKFKRQQVDAVTKSCEQIIDCSLEDARQELTPEQIAEKKLEDPKLLEKANSNCQEAYSAPMSPQQVLGLRECLSAASECGVFVECFGAALTPAE